MGRGRWVSRRWFPVAAAIGLACAATPRVEVDMLAGVDRDPPKRFVVDTGTLAAGEPAWGPTARRTAESALTRALAARGYEKAASEAEAEWRVAVGVRDGSREDPLPGPSPRADTRVERRTTGVRTPIGDVPLGEERRVVREPAYDAEAGARTVRTRTVVVEVRDLESDRVVWQGTSRGSRIREEIDLDDLQRRVRAIVAELP